MIKGMWCVLLVLLWCVLVVGALSGCESNNQSPAIYVGESPDEPEVVIEPVSPERELVRRIWKESYEDALQAWRCDQRYYDLNTVVSALFNARIQILTFGIRPIKTGEDQ